MGRGAESKKALKQAIKLGCLPFNVYQSAVRIKGAMIIYRIFMYFRDRSDYVQYIHVG